jgi:predicted MPP superfamily phosphohydrolase
LALLRGAAADIVSDIVWARHAEQHLQYCPVQTAVACLLHLSHLLDLLSASVAVTAFLTPCVDRATSDLPPHIIVSTADLLATLAVHRTSAPNLQDPQT